MRAGKRAQSQDRTTRARSAPAVSRRAAPIGRAAFTLVELIIAVAVLVVVILITSQIFGTASRITGVGHAMATVMQEAAVIERNMRNDIARITPEGLFAIRQVAVPNDINGAGQPLLNPMLPPNAMIRADQLLFFADGVAGMSNYSVFSGDPWGPITPGQSTTARVYYGHTFQLPNADGFDTTFGGDSQGLAHDPIQDVFPWHVGPVNMGRVLYSTVAAAPGTQDGTSIYGVVEAPPPVAVRQPEARRWLFARQAVALVDDDRNSPNTNQKTVYLNNNRTARSIFRPLGVGESHSHFGWTNEIRNGRMDGAASRPDDVWHYIRHVASAPDAWMDHRNIISAQLLYYPRAERIAPSAHRVDQALTNHVIGSAVSSFIVEWTWDDGVGDVVDDEGKMWCYQAGNLDNWQLWQPCSEFEVDHHPFGFYTNYPWSGNWSGNDFQPEQPWFGLNKTHPADDFCPNCAERGVGFHGFNEFDGYQQRANFKYADSIEDAFQIERFRFGDDHPIFEEYPDAERIRIYEAIFGSNRNRPVVTAVNASQEEVLELAPDFTPWPSAIRVTMVLHDPQGRLEHGREFQFVIDLPRRVR